MPLKDKYSWLEDATDPRVAEWAEEQDAAARKSVRRLSAPLFRRLARYYSFPIMRSVQLTEEGVFLFFSDDRSYKVQLLHRDGEKEEICDSKSLGRDVVIQGVQASEDGKTVAIHHSVGGSDEGTVSILDVETREPTDSLSGFIGRILWLKDGAYYYSRSYRGEKTPDGVSPPADRIFHRRGAKEEMVFGRGFETNTFFGIASSADSSKALLDAFQGYSRSTPYSGELERPETWAPVLDDNDAIVTNIDFSGGTHYLLSFRSGRGEVLAARDGRVRKVVRETSWPILDAVLVGDDLLCHYLVDACSEMRLYGLGGRRGRTIRFGSPGSLFGEPSMSALGKDAVFTFSSFGLPYRVYMLSGGKLRTLLSKELPGRYTVRQSNATSADGTKVHYFMTSRSGASPKKVLLFGYGGFRISLTPSFNPAYATLLEDGAGFAVANLRGGLEHGEDWHKAGMREKKFNVFDDYIAVLAKLRREGRSVVGFGRSNGGLLMGATMNARPDLLTGVLIGYPVLDMMAFHRLLVGRAWVPEYGDPDDPKDRRFLMKYSPYHHLSASKKYPPVFIYTGLKDDRVHPAHAFKFYSKLKELGSQVSLRVEPESGHIGTTPESRMREEADKLGFVYEVLGIDPEGDGSHRKGRRRRPRLER